MAASRLLLVLVAAVLVLGAPGLAPAQTPAPELSQKVSAELGKLRDLIEAKNYVASLALINRLFPAAAKDSYDRTLLSQIKAQIFLTEGRYTDAIAPLKEALRIGESRGHFSATTLPDSLFLLAQLHQQQASELKNAARQRTLLDQAIAYLNRWRTKVTKSTVEAELFTASLYYQRATLTPERVDAKALGEARLAAEEGLLLKTQPPASLYVFLLAIHQQRGELAEAAELLELLVEKNPDTAGNWQQLTSTYLTLASNSSNEREGDRHRLRALLSIERAQARGFLATPAEHFNVVALLLGLRQLEPAIALLEQGLADGRLESTRRNWELLASAYQQTRRDPLAIATLEKAVRALPEEGQLEFTLAQLHYAGTRIKEARNHLKLAIKKGRLDKPGQARLFLAYVSYELQDHKDALRWARDAAKFDDVKKEDLTRLTQAINEALRVRATDVSKS